MVHPDLRAFLGTSALMVAFVESVKFASTHPRGPRVSSVLARKVTHIGAGPIFLATWPLFSADTGRYVAACVPLTMTLKFAATGQ